MLAAGDMKNRVRFERRGTGTDDGYGNIQTAWAEITTVWAGFRPEFGSEQLKAGRLESTLRGSAIFRKSAAVSGVTAADRAVFTAGPYIGKTCQIISIIPMMDNQGIEMLLEEGGPT